MNRPKKGRKAVSNVTTARKGNPKTADATLTKLIALWRTHDSRDLSVRHQTGAMLNKQFGSPASRQDHGTATLRRYAETLGIERSELTRMRRFAFLFKSLAVLKKKHPDATTWTKVRELLPQHNPKPSNRPKTKAKATTRSAKTIPAPKATGLTYKGKPIARTSKIVAAIERAARRLLDDLMKIQSPDELRVASAAKTALARFHDAERKCLPGVNRRNLAA